MHDELVPIESEIVTCPSCRAELALDYTESRDRKYSCPDCNSTYALRTTTIAEEASGMIQRGEIPLSIWDKLDFWYAPLVLIVTGFVMILSLPIDGSILALLPIGIILVGLYHTYRAIVSAKFTFVSSSDSLSTKVAIVGKLQTRFKWSITEAKNGSFVFAQRNWVDSPREVMIFCTEHGYYINCMVHAARMGSGVSILQTREIIKFITANSDRQSNEHDGSK